MVSQEPSETVVARPGVGRPEPCGRIRLPAICFRIPHDGRTRAALEPAVVLWCRPTSKGHPAPRRNPRRESAVCRGLHPEGPVL